MTSLQNESMNSTDAIQASDLSTDTPVALCVVNAVFSLIAVTGNALVLGTIWKTPALHTPSSVLLFGLALSDVGVGFIVQPTFVICLIFGAVGTVYRAMQAIFVSATVLMLTAVSVDRFLALYLHLRYTVVVTAKRVLIVLFLIWAASALYALTLIVDIDLHRVLCVIVVLSSLVVNIIVYCMIIRIARHHLNQIQNHAQSNTADILNRKRQRRSAFNMFVIFLLLCFCYLPYIYVRIAVRFSQWPPSVIHLTIRWSAVLVYINSSLNPLVYCWRMRDLRTAMKDLMRNNSG